MRDGSERLSTSRRAFLAASAGVAATGLAGCSVVQGRELEYPGPTTRDGPPRLEPHPDVSNPVLTGDDVDDRLFTAAVADPFVAVEDDTYHMFFEIIYDGESSADIGHATSEDGIEWEYNQVVLDDPYHLAYPYVFKYGDEWYMTPDKATYDYNGVPEYRFYRADPFPTNWVLHERAVVNEHFGDPTPIKYGDTWYTFSIEQESVYGTRLHYADSLLDADWQLHPDSPLTTNRRYQRPAGRPVVLDDGLYFFYQDVERTYGDKVRCFEVDELTRNTYRHHEIDASPIIQSTRDGGWRDEGMHHVDPVLPYTGGENVVPVDGKDANGTWSVGLYRIQE